MNGMGKLYELFKDSDRETINSYIGKYLIHDVLKAYETAFGSPQILAYEWDILKAIVDTYLSSDEKSQRIFCEYLEYGISKQDDRARRASEKKIRRYERRLRIRCFLCRIFRHKNIAKSLEKQFGTKGKN